MKEKEKENSSGLVGAERGSSGLSLTTHISQTQQKKKKKEEEKKAEREAKIKVREEQKKAAREAKKRALQEKKAHDASILRFHSAHPNPSFSRGPKFALANGGVQSQLTKSSSGVELQAKESHGEAVEKAVAERALVKEEVTFNLEDADFPVLGKHVHVVRSPPGEVVAGKVVVEKAHIGKTVARKSGAKKA
ncbi:hypothetical protein ACLB2K_008383 [Fragaria x ananassa]